MTDDVQYKVDGKYMWFHGLDSSETKEGAEKKARRYPNNYVRISKKGGEYWVFVSEKKRTSVAPAPKKEAKVKPSRDMAPRSWGHGGPGPTWRI